MPAVRIKGWQPDRVPSVPLPSLIKLLEDKADMDVDQVADTLKRLKKGRDVDIPFDPGDEGPPRGMMKRLAALGLESELTDDTPGVDAGLPSWLLRYVGGEDREDRITRARLYPWILGAALLIAVAVRAPWLGVLFLAIVVGGIGCAVVIRQMTRRSERRIEVLERFSPNDKVDHQSAPTSDRG